MNRPLTRHLIALAVAAMGLIDLISALLSHPPERIQAIRHVLPTDVLDTSRTFTLLAGALLLVTAWGLRRGKRRAFVTALLLGAVSVPMNLLKAFDFEEATLAAGLMFALGVTADAFRVKSRDWSFRDLRSTAFAFIVGVALYAWIGCWILEARLAPGNPGASWRAVKEVLYQVFGVGSETLILTPWQRHHGVTRWFLDSFPLLSFVTVIGIALAALQPAAHRGRHRAERERAAALARQYGDSTVAAFALADDTDYFFSANRRAVIAYKFESDTLLVIGDPIGPPEEIPPLLEAFAEHCRGHDWQFAFYQARPEHLPWYRARGWRAVHIGEDPVLWTDRFTLEGSAIGQVRRMVHRLERAGLVADMYLPDERPFDAAHDAEGLLEPLRAISAEWVREHPGGEKGFCMGRFDPARLAQVWLAIAWAPATRRVEGFVSWTPIWARRGWALDLMRRRRDAAAGTMEFLVAKCVEKAKERGDAMLSLSLSALAKVDEPGDAEPAGESAPGARSGDEAARGAAAATPEAEGDRRGAAARAGGFVPEDRAREFLRERLARFYDFEGLFRWKKKFAPAFEDRYLIYPDPLALPRIARALLRVQSPGGLLSYLRQWRGRPKS
ncbi:MAG TPA: phosphatidylglycerol lysyltransferase domain-containing protein [Terriglobales bacterium]|nr:phosphatidylglycerol lysyltransferase domain-containing protein [Terriglobales bacterium]